MLKAIANPLTCDRYLHQYKANEQYSSGSIVSVPLRILWCSLVVELVWRPVAILQTFQRHKQGKRFLYCTANFDCRIAAMTVGLPVEGVSIGRWPPVEQSSSQDRFRSFEGRKSGRNGSLEDLYSNANRYIYNIVQTTNRLFHLFNRFFCFWLEIIVFFNLRTFDIYGITSHYVIFYCEILRFRVPKRMLST